MNKPTGQWEMLYVENQEAWERWLEDNHQTSPGVRLQIAKKGSGRPTVSYDQALEAALCYGWVDSRKEALDDSFWIQRFGPRGPRSIWSKINKEKAEKLIEDGRMQPAGLRAIERAREKGQWESAYESQGNSTIPEDLQLELERDPQAKAFFETLDSRNRYAILFRIHHAKKPETRQKRIRQFMEMLNKGEKIYP